MAPRHNTARSSPAFAAAATATSLAGLAGLLYYLDVPALFKQRIKARKVERRCYSVQDSPSLAEFKLLIDQETLHETYPLAWKIEKNVPVYRSEDFDLASGFSSTPSDKKTQRRLEQLKDELYHNLTSGPGAYVIKTFFRDTTTLDDANEAFAAIATCEAAEAASSSDEKKKGDHFAPASANTRIWNSFSKHCLQDPSGFLKYYSNPWFHLVCDSYLGPGYKITTQMNTVRPGGAAQMPHRDYHLGFQTDEDVVAWPKVVHALSGMLTLQGAVAHTDMPLASGPTRLLPFSQTFGEGFRAFRRPEFVEKFQRRYIALPLEKGDALFFSPALFHAAGENVTSDFDRTANLVQVSSAFGKTMETVDTLPLIEVAYEGLRAMFMQQGMSADTDAFIRAVAEGYPFPTNLDCRPPAPGGMAPESEQDILRRCIREGVPKGAAMRELSDMREASSASGKISRQTTVFGT